MKDQAKVIRKANAYAELIITSNCRYKMPEQLKGKRVNYVKAYLDRMTKAEVTEVKNDTKQALEDLEDTNRSMGSRNLSTLVTELARIIPDGLAWITLNYTGCNAISPAVYLESVSVFEYSI